MKTIRLTQGRATTVDDLDYPGLQRHKWYLQTTKLPTITKYYAASKIDGKEEMMHRHLTRALPGQSVDHLNGNGLDNRRSNLRICTHAENMANKQPAEERFKAGFITSRYKGAYSHECKRCDGEGEYSYFKSPKDLEPDCIRECETCHGSGKRWRACISVKTRTRALGTFDTEEEAAKAYDTAALAAWGSWARTNFPQEGEQ